MDLADLPPPPDRRNTEEEEDLDGEYLRCRYGRRGISFHPRRGGGRGRGSGETGYSVGRGRGGGVGGLGGVVAAGPGRMIYSRGRKGQTVFLRMQLRQPQLSWRRRRITGGTMSFRPTGGEERIPRGRGRRCPCTALARGEADIETTRVASTMTATGIRMAIGILSAPGGRRTTRANQWRRRQRCR